MKIELIKTIIIINNPKIGIRINAISFSNELLFDIKNTSSSDFKIDVKTPQQNIIQVFEEDSINTEKDSIEKDSLPTIILTKSSSLNTVGHVVSIEEELFYSSNFNVGIFQFAIKNAIEKYELYKQTKAYALEIGENKIFLNQLTTAFSDQLKEPITIISKYVELLRQRYEFALDKIGHQFLDYISRETFYQEAQLSRLLDYLLLDKDDYQEREVLDVNEVVKVALGTIDGITEMDETVFILNYSNLPKVEYNRYTLLLIFNELISNAIKYKRFNELVTINIDIKETESDWIVEVTDNGEGFEIEKNEVVFELYQKLHNKFLYKGVGLGLSICKKIIEKNGGQINIQSVVNQGTVVEFTIPR